MSCFPVLSGSFSVLITKSPLLLLDSRLDSLSLLSDFKSFPSEPLFLDTEVPAALFCGIGMGMGIGIGIGIGMKYGKCRMVVGAGSIEEPF